MINMILNLLRTDAYITVNKNLARNIGLAAATIFCELAARFNYFSSRGELREGYFYCTNNDLKNATGLSKDEQETAIKKLIRNNLIEKKVMKIKGDEAPKRYFKITQDSSILANILKTNEPVGFAENPKSKCGKSEIEMREIRKSKCGKSEIDFGFSAEQNPPPAYNEASSKGPITISDNNKKNENKPPHNNVLKEKDICCTQEDSHANITGIHNNSTKNENVTNAHNVYTENKQHDNSSQQEIMKECWENHVAYRMDNDKEAFYKEWQTKIFNIIGDRISFKRLEGLVRNCGFDRILYHMDNWGTHKKNQTKKGAGYFIYVVENDVPPIEPEKKAIYEKKIPQRDFFEQRDYSDEELEKYYVKYD